MVSMNTAWGEDPALSYRDMRATTGYVTLALPVVLLLAGLVDGHFETSLSAYYYTKVGNVFTGTMCVIGVFLLAYRLTVWAIDNIATTLAGLCALGVAFFHAVPPNATPYQVTLSHVHLACATVLLIIAGAISLFIFPRDVMRGQRWRGRCYRALGALIWVSLALVPTLSSLAGSFYNSHHVFIILESVCMWAFAAAFILKGHDRPGGRRRGKVAAQPAYAVPLQLSVGDSAYGRTPSGS